MIEVSAKAWPSILYVITPWQYPSRLGMLSSISPHALAVSVEAWHAYYSISYHALAVSAEAWYAVLYHITPWQYQPRRGMLFFNISHLGCFHQGLECYSISTHLGSIYWGLAYFSICYHVPFALLPQACQYAFFVFNLNCLTIFKFEKKKLCGDIGPPLSSGAQPSSFACALLGVFGSIIVQLRYDDILRLSCGTCASMISCGTCAWAASLQARAQLTPLDFNAASAAASLHH